MTSYRRGDVVLVAFPYANLVTWGKRPALVVQDEITRTELDHYVLAQITSTPRSGPLRIAVGRETDAGRAMHLLQDSVILTDVLQSTEESLIERRIGVCPCMDQVDTALRALLALPRD